jgi:hypothetical protein
MVANQGKITTLAVDASVNKGLVDGTDKMHSGLLKVLESFAQGNICISHAGFTITDGGDYTQYNLAQPIKFFSNGEFTNHTVTLTEAYTSTVQDATHSRYDWVLINPATPELIIVQGTAGATPLVSDITAGFIPIALVHITAGTDNDKFDYAFQTFTMNVSENSLSVGYNASGYTEAMSIVATADRTTFKNKVANADIRFILADNTADEKFEILSDDDSDGDEGDTTVFSVDGLGATSIAGTLNLGSVAAAGTDTDKFLVLDSGGNVDFRAGSDVASDIGALTAEADTLDTVTGRGATTTNSISVATITSTANQNLSYEVITAATPISGLKTVVYSSAINGNTAALPAPASGNILTVVNLDAANPITLTGTPLINNGAVGHPKLTAPNVITLAPFEHVTLQAVNDTLGILQTGHIIISN